MMTTTMMMKGGKVDEKGITTDDDLLEML